MSRTRPLAVAAAVATLVLTGFSGPAMASHGGGGGGGGTPPPPPPTGTLSVTPMTASFAPQAVGTASPPLTVTVSNTGSTSVFFNAESQGGPDPLDFTDTNSQCVGVSLAPGTSCVLTLAFRPTATGTRTATVQLFDNASGSPQTITMTGAGTSVNGPTPFAVDTTGQECTGGVCSLTASIVNNFYLTPLRISGESTAPYTWSVAAGSLPTGLSLATDGEISGIATTVGTSTFTVRVNDAAGRTATQALSLSITPAPSGAGPGCTKVPGAPGSVSQQLSGPAIRGKVPHGRALADESRITTCGGSTLLDVSLSNVNLPDGSLLWIYFDSRLVGRVAITAGSATMPRYNLGDYLIRKDGVLVYDTPPPVAPLQQAVLSGPFFR